MVLVLSPIISVSNTSSKGGNYCLIGWTRSPKIITNTDNGGGITEDILDKIFDPHFTIKYNKELGIGLYISKMIIESKMGGKFTARNSEQGAVFMVEI